MTRSHVLVFAVGIALAAALGGAIGLTFLLDEPLSGVAGDTRDDDAQSQDDVTADSDSGAGVVSVPNTDSSQTSLPKTGYFPMFSLNIHDWGNVNESIATTRRVLAIHEEYQVPVDLYFTDPLFRAYMQTAPDLIEDIKTSSVATAAYHIRPPLPYYSGFDWLGLSDMTDVELRSTIEAYETHALSLETGKPTNEVGGYRYFVDTIGYALGVGTTGQGNVGKVVADVYHDMGAKFMVGHGKGSSLGQEALAGLYYRPEDYDLKLYESAVRTQDGGAVIENVLSSLNASTTQKFIGIKYHEDNFYTTGGTPWWPVYWEDQSKTTILYPPYDTTKGTAGAVMQSQKQQDADWALYESAVQYVAEHPDLHAVNLRDLAEALGL